MSERSSNPDRHIVVGIDNSDGARRALAWAVDEARLRSVNLDVITAWELPIAWAQGYNTEVAGDVDTLGYDAESAAVQLVSEVIGSDDRPEWIRVYAVEGPAASVLLRLSETAELLVVGTRGRGGFARLLLGSVSNAVVHHTSCPVVIVPAPQAD